MIDACDVLPWRQTGFINYIVKPMFELWGQFIPPLVDLFMQNVQSNLAVWAAEVSDLPIDQCYADSAKLDWSFTQVGYSPPPC